MSIKSWISFNHKLLFIHLSIFQDKYINFLNRYFSLTIFIYSNILEVVGTISVSSHKNVIHHISSNTFDFLYLSTISFQLFSFIITSCHFKSSITVIRSIFNHLIDKDFIDLNIILLLSL